MALSTRTVNISLRFPVNTSTATVRFIPDLAAGDAQVLLEKYYDVTVSTGAPNTTLTATKDLPVFVDPTKSINYRVQFPRETGLNEHYISLSKGTLNSAGQPNDPIDLSLLLTLAAASGNQFSLDDLTDVVITSPTAGEYLRYDGSLWVDANIAVGDLPASVMLKTTYDTDTDGVVDKAAQVVMTVRNNAGSQLQPGEIVYVDPTGSSGNHVKVKRALATSDTTSANTLGMVLEQINDGADGKIALHGLVEGVTTNTFEEGNPLYLSASVAGGLTTTRPTPPNHGVFIGWVTKKAGGNGGKIALHIQNGYELDELHDVLITAPVNGEILTYESATGLWKNKASSALTMGNPVGGGGANRVLFEDAAQVLASSGAFIYDSINADLVVDTATMGQLGVGAAFGHQDYFTTLSYALKQDALTGATFLNAKNYSSLHFRINNNPINELNFDGTYWTVRYDDDHKMSMQMNSTGKFDFNVYAGVGNTPSFYFNGKIDVDGNVITNNNSYVRAGSAAMSKVLIEKLDSNGDPLSGTVGGGGFAYFDYDGATVLNYLNTTDYAIQQDVYGNTYVNAGAGWNPVTDTVTAGRLYLRNDNSKNQQMVFDGSYWNIEQWTTNVKQYHMSMEMATTGIFKFNVYADAGASTPSFYFNGATDIAGVLSLTNNGYLLSGAAAVGNVLGDATLAFKGFNPSASPVNHFTDTNYAVRQNYLGHTYVNAPTGSRIYLTNNNSLTYSLNFDGEYWTHWYDVNHKMSTKMNSTGKFEFNVYAASPTVPYFYFNGKTQVYGKLEVLNSNIMLAGASAVGDISGDAGFAFQGFNPSASPVDHLTGTNYALRQNYIGDTYLNAPTAGTVYIRKNNSSTRQMVFDGTNWYFEYTSGTHFSTTVSSTGVVTFDAAGSGAKFTFSDKVEVPDDAYAAGWNGSTEVPTKNAVYDKIETLFTLPSLTSGSVLFSNGSTIAQDNANFFWDNSNDRLGIRTTSPQNALDVTAASSFGQMRLSWDSTYYTRFLATSTGGLSILTSHEAVNIASVNTPQFKISYDASNYFTTAVNSAGLVTFDTTGAAFVFDDGLRINETGGGGPQLSLRNVDGPTNLDIEVVDDGSVTIGGGSLTEVQVLSTIGALNIGAPVTALATLLSQTTSTSSPQLTLRYNDGTVYDLDFQVADDGVTITAPGVPLNVDGINGINFNTGAGNLSVFQGTLQAQRIESTPIVSRVVATASSATPTPNADETDLYSLTALATNPTFGAPTGTPVNGQKLLIRIKDNGTARTLNWNAAYVAGGASLPTTTVINKTMHLGFIYNADNSLNKWMLIAKAEEA